MTGATPVVVCELACPHCGCRHTETMPVDACIVFFACSECKAVLRPKPGDCCVFCSWGDVPSPPMQAMAQGGNACCAPVA